FDPDHDGDGDDGGGVDGGGAGDDHRPDDRHAVGQGVGAPGHEHGLGDDDNDVHRHRDQHRPGPDLLARRPDGEHDRGHRVGEQRHAGEPGYGGILRFG